MKNQRVINLREGAGLTQGQLAKKIGVSQSMIARIEARERDPRTHIKLKLARYFRVRVEWLFYEETDDLKSLHTDHAATIDATGTEGGE